ncbi:MAG: trigger factor [Acidimicrobiia bacterium]|nr:trigger factor [Acidimicrobiia bacterium]MDH5520672.1 trigger factor [Acidimicrobiia bacterium]
MRSTIEPLEGNKVKVVVEVEEAEFDKELDAAFRRLAKDVRLPGFRPGKAPRKVLEARIGQGYAREEAFRHSLPDYYSKAVIEHQVDVIAPPEIDITDGMDSGGVTFDAVVEVRPSIEVGPGYEALEVEIPRIDVTDEDLDEAVDRLRGQFSELETVERPAAEGDRVSIDIAATHHGDPVPGMTADDYSYEVGSGATGIPEIDEQVVGASAGDELEFTADYPDTGHDDDDDDDDAEEEPLHFTIKVNAVQENVLPEATDEWVAEHSEFATLADLRDDYRTRMQQSRIHQGQAARRNKIAEAISALVDDESVPEAMVSGEVENRIQDMAMRLQAQGLSLEQYLQFSGQDPQSMTAELTEAARSSAKLDLALRAIATQEAIAVTDDEVDAELEKAATQFDRSADELKAEFIEHGHLPQVRADLLKSKTLDWLITKTKVIDEDGQLIPADALELPEDESDDQEEE